MRNSTRVTLLVGVLLLSLAVVLVGRYRYTHPLPKPATTVSVIMSEHGHVVHIFIVPANGTMNAADREVDRFLEEHPELWCTSMAHSADYRSVTLLCNKVGAPPAENAQSQTGPP